MPIFIPRRGRNRRSPRPAGRGLLSFSFDGGSAPVPSACHRGLRAPAPRGLSTGPPRPRTVVLAVGACPAPCPGSLFPRRKSDQNAAGGTPDPVVCPIGRLQERCPVATEIPRASGLLVIGQAGHGLRLTALGMIVVSCYATIDPSAPSKGRQPKLDKKPATDQMLKNLVQWQRAIKT